MAVAGDKQAALFGLGCFEEGVMKGTYSTGCFIHMNTEKNRCYTKNGLLTKCGCETGRIRTYALEGSMFIGGVVQ
jgi:glycerol kinase